MFVMANLRKTLELFVWQFLNLKWWLSTWMTSVYFSMKRSYTFLDEKVQGQDHIDFDITNTFHCASWLSLFIETSDFIWFLHTLSGWPLYILGLVGYKSRRSNFLFLDKYFCYSNLIVYLLTVHIETLAALHFEGQ
jgi:hypothetical protein